MTAVIDINPESVSKELIENSETYVLDSQVLLLHSLISFYFKLLPCLMFNVLVRSQIPGGTGSRSSE